MNPFQVIDTSEDVINELVQILTGNVSAEAQVVQAAGPVVQAVLATDPVAQAILAAGPVAQVIQVTGPVAQVVGPPEPLSPKPSPPKKQIRNIKLLLELEPDKKRRKLKGLEAFNSPREDRPGDF